MYWGKSLDQCTNQFCNTSWTFSLPFTKNSQTTPQNQQIRIQPPKTSLKNNMPDRDKLSQKRSLKKTHHYLNSQTSSSLNTSAIFSPQTKNLTNPSTSKKTNIRNFSIKQPLLITNIHNLSTNDNTLRYDTLKHAQSQQCNPAGILQRVQSKQNKTKDLLILKFSNQVPLYENFQTKNCPQIHTSFKQHVPSYTNPNSSVQQNGFNKRSFDRFQNFSLAERVSPNGRNYENVIENQNTRIYNVRQESFQTMRYHQNSHINNVVPLIHLNSPRNVCDFNHQRYTPVQSIQNLVSDQTRRHQPNQFPTIREQNSTYEQSKSINEYQMVKQQKPVIFHEVKQNNQHFPLLGPINNSFSLEQQKNEETFYEVIRNHEPMFQPGLDSSNIEGQNKVSQFNLSCEQLLLESQKTHQLKEQLEDLRIYEEIQKQKLALQNNKHIQRRKMHQPSICLKVIENKLRATSYQMSQTSSQGIKSQFRQSNFVQSHEEVIPSFASPDRITSPRQESQALTMRAPCQGRMFKNSVRFNLANKSNFVQDKQNQCEQNSPIKILDSDREIQLHNLATFSKEKENKQIKVVHYDLLKQQNVKEISSDKDLQPSIRKICVNSKKVKSLIQHKMMIDSIFEDSSSLMKNQCSNQLVTKYILDENFENLDGILSNQNVERDESTVIDRYTFDSKLYKLP